MRESRSAGGTATACTASDLFAALWATLVDMIGPTAAAALLQRSVKRAAAGRPRLLHLVIAREQFVYGYDLPDGWSGSDEQALDEFRVLMRELCPLLVELTGTVVLRRLRDVPLLRDCDVIPEGAAQ